MLSHIIELRKFLDKKLLCDFQVAATEFKMFDKVVETDKWLRFEDWQQVYDKLDKMLASDLTKLYSEDFQIADNIEVHVEKLPLANAYRDIFLLDEEDVVPVILLIKISKVNVEALKKRIAKLEKYNKKSCKNCSKEKVKIKVRKDLCKEYDPVKASGGGHGDAPVYKPSAKIASCFVKIDGRQEEEEYSPKPISTQSEKFNFEEDIEGSLDCYNPSTEESPNQNVPQYIPSEIKSLTDDKEDIVEISSTSDAVSPEKKTKESSKSISLRSGKKRPRSEEVKERESQAEPELAGTEGGRQTRSKKRRGNEGCEGEKRRLSQDLFGSDDSEHEDMLSKRSDSKGLLSKDKDDKKDGILRYLKSEKVDNIKSEKDDKLSNQASPKRPKDDNRNKKSTSDKKSSYSKSSSKENGKCTKKKQKPLQSSQSQSSSSTPTKPKLTEEEKQRNRDNHQKEMEMLKHYKEELQALNKTPPPVEIIKLYHLTSDKLVATFDEFKPDLDKLFKQHKKRKTHVVKPMEDMDHLLTMSIIEDEKCIPLLNHLREKYETDPDTNVPSYTDLFMSLMLPEWVLAIFMKEYNLRRSEAIERIKAQNQLDTSNSSFS